ncbi:MAG: hypothetical protein Q9Q40_14835 [Acidobacteriota bacterium]|nr:hypothetical protein [Acidobacteriota bacterium]MDQ7086869.1 hypothetical protein [Acidobacteriota bacterium]
MNAAWLHLVCAHLVVVLVPVAALLALIARLAPSRLMEHTAGALLVLAAVVSAVAYFSGPSALEIIDPQGDLVARQAESHAVAGRIAFSVVVLTGALALVALLQAWQGEAPGPLLLWAVVLAAGAAGATLLWTAHLGGVIRHPEIRPLVAFPPETP